VEHSRKNFFRSQFGNCDWAVKAFVHGVKRLTHPPRGGHQI
jgi:hypothetical protein